MQQANLFKTSIILAAVAFAAGPAQAQSANWTGFYVGGGVGGVHYEITAAPDDDALIGGLLAGYDYDMGTWVVGAGVDIDFSDATITPVDLDRIWRLKVRGGFKIGNGLLYATGGYTNIDLSIFGDDDGYFIGGGYEHQIGSNFSVGGEVLYHKVDSFTGLTTRDVEVTTYQIRGAFRF